MNKVKLIGLTSIAALALALVVGCKATLQPGGAYAPQTTNSSGQVVVSADMALFTADSAFYAAYTTIDTVFALERDNRQLFWSLSPSIKHTLDSIRPTAVEVRNGYLNARAAYIMNPGPTTLASINDWLAKIQAITSAVSAALPSSTASQVTNVVVNPQPAH